MTELLARLTIVTKLAFEWLLANFFAGWVPVLQSHEMIPNERNELSQHMPSPLSSLDGEKIRTIKGCCIAVINKRR